MDNHVLRLISALRNSFVGAEEVYTKGSCVQVYLILRTIWPNARLWYNQNHALTEIDGKFYDITGQVKPDKSYVLISDIGNARWKRNLFRLRYNIYKDVTPNFLNIMFSVHFSDGRDTVELTDLSELQTNDLALVRDAIESGDAKILNDQGQEVDFEGNIVSEDEEYEIAD